MKWNPNFGGIPLIESAECAIQLCNAAESKDANRNTGGLPAYSMSGCWLRDLKEIASDADWTLTTSGNASAFWRVWSQQVALNPDWPQREVFPYIYGVQGEDGQAEWKWMKTQLTLTSGTGIGYAAGIELAEAWENFLEDQMSTGACDEEARSSLNPFIYSSHFEQFYLSQTLFSEMAQGVAIAISVALVVLVLVTGNIITGSLAAFTIGMIVCWVMAMIPILGWELGMVENIVLVMVPGLSVDFTAHLAEAYNGAKYDDREHRVIHALEHSGVSIISGAISTMLAAMCLLLCGIQFFFKFGVMILCTIAFAVIFSLFFFPSVMCLIGPTGVCGDWHHFISPKLDREFPGDKPLRVSARVSEKARSSVRRSQTVGVVVGTSVGVATTDSSHNSL